MKVVIPSVRITAPRVDAPLRIDVVGNRVYALEIDQRIHGRSDMKIERRFILLRLFVSLRRTIHRKCTLRES